MNLDALSRAICRVEDRARAWRWADHPLLGEVRQDPVRLMTAAGLTPDAWQAAALQSDAERTLLLASRQAGKSSVSAALAVKAALVRPGSPVLLLSPSQRQSAELFRKVLALYAALGQPVPAVRETAAQLELANGSRVLSLRGSESTVRGFSEVEVIVMDEAERVEDVL